MHTLVFKKVAHASSAGEDELRDVLDDLGLLLRRQCSEPLCQALGFGQKTSCVVFNVMGWHHTTLPWRDRRMRYLFIAVSHKASSRPLDYGVRVGQDSRKRRILDGHDGNACTSQHQVVREEKRLRLGLGAWSWKGFCAGVLLVSGSSWRELMLARTQPISSCIKLRLATRGSCVSSCSQIR